MQKRVVIVGGGVVGLWCAIRLRQGGAQVTLIEAESDEISVFGPAASAAAAGMLAPVEQEASLHERLAHDSYDLWKKRVPGAEWEDGVRFDGAIVLSSDGQQAEALRFNATRLGCAAKPLSARDLRKRWPFESAPPHATFVANEGVADPLRVLTGLTMQAKAMGVLTEYNTDIASVTGQAAMTHEGRVYDADTVLLAPGVWATDRLMAAAPALKRIRPAKGQLVSVALPGALGSNVRGPGFYLAQRREDVVLGATLELDRFDRRPSAESTATLLAAARAYFPNEIQTRDRAWAGIRPMSPDGWPMIGPSGDGLLVAAGHSRNGWLLAPITAEIISAYVFGGDIPPEWAALSPQRFENT
jgi:glycine oxidase